MDLTQCSFGTTFINATFNGTQQLRSIAPSTAFSAVAVFQLWRTDKSYTNSTSILSFDFSEHHNGSSCLSADFATTCIWCLPDSCEIASSTNCTVGYGVHTCPGTCIFLIHF